MTKEQKYNEVCGAFTGMENNGKTISIYDEKLAGEVKDNLQTIQQELGADFELSYEIMADACLCLSDIEFNKLELAELYDTETASVYTAVRLSYLSPKNEYDITETSKEMNCDIQTACAIWYDRQVSEACEQIRAYILAD